MAIGPLESFIERFNLDCGCPGNKSNWFKSLHEAIDTNSSAGKLIFHIFGTLAEFERNLIRERTYAGLAAARVRGRSSCIK